MSLPALLVAALLAGLVAGGTGAWKVQAWRWEAAEGARLEAEAAAQRLRAQAADEAAARHEAEKAAIAAQRRVLTKEIERVVEKPVYRNVCLDDDGLRLVEAAARGTDPAGEPAPAVPASAAAR